MDVHNVATNSNSSAVGFFVPTGESMGKAVVGVWEECDGVLEGRVGFVRVGVRAIVLDGQDLGEGDDGYESARGRE